MNGKQLKNSILQWAIQGKLVPQDPNDEPASVLLEQIRAEKARLIKEKKIKKDKNESVIYRGDDSSYYEKFADGTIKCIDDEMPFEIPASWEWTRIHDISQSYIGLTYKPSDVSPSGTIVLRSSNIQNGKLVLNDIVRVNTSIAEKLWVEKNDIIICARNGSKKLVGKSAIIDRLDEPMTFGAFMAICKTSIFKYVYLFLQSELFFAQLRGVSGTTTINQLTQNNFNRFLIPIPPQKEQIRICEKYSLIEPIIEKYSVAQDKLDNINNTLAILLKKSIIQEAIQGRLVPQIAEEGTAQELLDQIQVEKLRLVKEGRLKKKDLVSSTIFRGDDNKYYEQIGSNTFDIDEEIPFSLPETWQWVRLSSLANLHIGKTPARGVADFWNKGKYPWVSISDMQQGEVIFETKEKVSEIAATQQMGVISPKGSLIMSFKLTVGRTSILGVDAYHNEAIITINSWYDNDSITRDYLAYILPCLSNFGDSKDAIKGKTLNSKSLATLLIPLPPLQEQRRITKKVYALYKKF